MRKQTAADIKNGCYAQPFRSDAAIFLPMKENSVYCEKWEFEIPCLSVPDVVLWARGGWGALLWHKLVRWWVQAEVRHYILKVLIFQKLL